MNPRPIDGFWTAAMERIKARWHEFASNELEHSDYDWEVLCARVQQRHALSREDTERILRNV